MTDITERLRRLYVADGTNYVQEAADLIECLRAERKSMVNDVHSCHANCTKAGCVNRRLRDALLMCRTAGDGLTLAQEAQIRAALGETK